jgi:GABA(A) receptor-associated protein
MNLSFKNEFTFQQRFTESTRVLTKYPERIPIVCEPSSNVSDKCPLIDKKKYLVPRDLTMGQFLYVIRKRLNLAPEKALFLFVNNNILSTTNLMGHVYRRYRDNDKYLYISYAEENTFGNNNILLH